MSRYALWPILDIGDRSPVAYEVLERPSVHLNGSVAAFEQALRLVSLVSPAVLFLRADVRLIEGLGESISGVAAASGVMASEIVWILGSGTRSGPTALECEHGRLLAAQGFRLAFDGVTIASLADPELVQLDAAYVMVAAGVAGRLRSGTVAQAEISALLSFFARLRVRVVARGVDDENTAQLLGEAGLRFGVGRHLQAPVVLDPAIAEPGDELVTRAWFRARAVRVLGQGGKKSVPVSYSDLTRVNTDLDDRAFAQFLGEAARHLQAEHDATGVLALVAAWLPRIVPVDRMAIFEADWDSYSLRPRVVMGGELQGLSDLEDPMESGITGWAFLRGDPYLCGDTFSHEAAIHIPGSAGGRIDESLLVIPLVAGDNRLGVLDLWRDGLDSFSDVELERCALFGYLAAAAWRNAQLYAELEQRAVTDLLTGLLNKRWWAELAPREASQALRTETRLAILVVDLDNFKRVNDTCGHAVGDVTLRNTARVLSTAVRSGDAAVRLGGDEFLLVLHDSDERGAERVAETVRSALAALPSVSEYVGPITASIGIAMFPDHGASLEEVVHEADLAMYRAKGRGRDRVVLCAPPEPLQATSGLA
jgi:diguanylate cyclase (GGDEF)-like protein